MYKNIALLLVLLGIYVSSFGQAYVPGQVLVQFRQGVDPQTTLSSDWLKNHQATIVSCASHSFNIWLIQGKPTEEDQLMTDLYAQKGVLVTQLNHYVKPRSTTPNDAQFANQWGLLNTGQNGGVAGVDINVAPAWDITTGGLTAIGDTIVVAVIDGGMDLAHQDLNYWKNYHEIPNNGIDDDHNGYIDDYDGWNATNHNGTISVDYHGTEVAGIVGAKGNNSIGVSGVNWNVKVMPLMLLNYTEAEVVEDYTYIFDQRKAYNTTGGTSGAFVVATNSSFGIDYGQPADYPLWCAMYDSMGSIGILSAAATANSHFDIDATGDMPTACPSDYLVTVTDMTRTGSRNNAAGYGLTTIDLEAPGTAVLSTVPGNGYAASSGTSFASPHVAGAIGLLYAAGCTAFDQYYEDHPDSVALLLKHYVISTTDSMPDMIGNSVSGGRLDVYKSMQRLINDFCDTCMTLTVNQLPITCNGEANGSATLQISGGVAPYNITWSTGDTTYQRGGIGPGSYNIEVVDSAGCHKAAYFHFSEPDPIITGYTVTQDTNQLSTGAINTQVQGGIQPYHFMWSNGDTSQSLSGLASDTYYVTITDANGCIRQDSVLVRTITGIDDIVLASQITLYPNPTSGDVTLQLPTIGQPASIELIDLLGRSLLTANATTGHYLLPLSQFGKGVYLLRVTTGNKQVVKKLVRL